MLCQDGTVFAVARDSLKHQAGHFVGRLQTVSYRLEPLVVWIARVIRAVVVRVMHQQLGALGQHDWLSILVIALPIEIPVFNPNQPLPYAVWEQSVTL